MIHFNFNAKIKTFYSYRRAFVNQSFYFDLDILSKEELRSFIKEEGHNFDNHITFELDNGLWFTYSDGTLYVGTSVRVKSW